MQCKIEIRNLVDQNPIAEVGRCENCERVAPADGGRTWIVCFDWQSWNIPRLTLRVLSILLRILRERLESSRAGGTAGFKARFVLKQFGPRLALLPASCPPPCGAIEPVNVSVRVPTVVLDTVGNFMKLQNDNEKVNLHDPNFRFMCRS